MLLFYPHCCSWGYRSIEFRELLLRTRIMESLYAACIRNYYSSSSFNFRPHLWKGVSLKCRSFWVEIRKSGRKEGWMLCKHSGYRSEVNDLHNSILIFLRQGCELLHVIYIERYLERGEKKGKSCKGNFFIYKQWNCAWKRRNYNTSFSSGILSFW